MAIQRFEDLVIWQEARQLCSDIYKELSENKDFGFRDQIQRAVVSIMNNIAEGFDRSKQSKDNKLFISFLNIASGSCGEVKSMLYLASDLSYISDDMSYQLRNKCLSLTMKISTLITTLQENNGKNNRNT